ncbi:formamidopyrimidine-DNA glycosylase [Geoanaerobacter pelophilus]|uniref:Formamidopyrimidine-DNA glycosylase n=1 Tax=Geoanaerobacter pelophilus TaxID=60036 RepID=A0ABQ0MPT0_9BACT|nr:DNA-formamidopyrimidine glycosylase family protein [Geoanaerobacter pelophilus]GAW69081.1 formamidopyrimidine-DNA glycosylase [Geoanaerobacter pelophilus]
MPELPDLTIYAENLDKKLAGKKVRSVSFHGRGRLNVAPDQLSSALTGAKIAAVKRTGKQVSFQADNGAVLRVHLMLTGGFVLAGADQLKGVEAPVVSIAFTDGCALAVSDPKGWATLTLNPQPEREAPDALDVSLEQLQQLCARKPKALIKALLLDQSLIGGIGNAYADEILWEARISPKSAAGKLPPEAVSALARAIPAVLEDAIAELRKRHTDMVSGEYREFLKVHRPGLKKSPTGAPVIKENVSSKQTYYTDEQRLYR